MWTTEWTNETVNVVIIKGCQIIFCHAIRTEWTRLLTNANHN